MEHPRGANGSLRQPGKEAVFELMHMGSSVIKLLGRLNVLYLLGLVGLEVFCSFFCPIVAQSLPFLPLMLISMYCAMGLMHQWGSLSWLSMSQMYAVRSSK